MSENNFKKLEEEHEIDPLQLSGIEHKVHNELHTLQSIGNFFSAFLGRLIGVVTAMLGGTSSPEEEQQQGEDR